MSCENSPASVEFPADVLHLILNKLSKISDQISFKFVCKHWYNVAKQKKLLPFLLTPMKFLDQPELFDLNSNAYVPNTTLQWDHNNIPRRFCGSSFGWLASTTSSNLSFTNPFRSQTLTFPLPPGTPLAPDLPLDRTVLKAILSKNPTLFPNDYAVVAIHYKPLRLSYFKSGALKWVEILNQDKLRPFADVAMFKGRVYAISYFGGLGVFDIDKEELHVVVPDGKEMGYVHMAHLVESSRGKLLQVRRFVGFAPMTEPFDVFVLEESDGGNMMRWIRVESLGEDALFLGVNDSISVNLGSNNNDYCESNCIYYTHSNHRRSQSSRLDMGIYNLARRKLISRQLYINDSLDEDLPPPVWIQPF